MLITAIQIKLMENTNTKLRGVAVINLDNMVVIKEIKILYSDEKYFLAMPSRATKVGTFKDVVHPINASVREAFEALIIGGYKKAEKDGYSKIELSYMDNGKNSLLNQTIGDFSVNGQKGGLGKEREMVRSFPKKTLSKMEVAKMNDSLLEWLES